MTRFALPRRLIAMACIVVMTAMAFVGTSVLCVASGGHVDLEGLFQNCCGRDPSAGSAANTQGDSPASLEAHACGGCTDVAFSSEGLAARGREGSDIAAAQPATAAPDLVASGTMDRATIAQSAALAPPRSRVVLNRLQGVLLRC